MPGSSGSTWQQFAAFGVQDKHQAVKKRHRPAEDAVKVNLRLLDALRLHISNKAARELWENLYKDAVFQPFAQRSGVVRRFLQQPFQKSLKRLSPEQQPPVFERANFIGHGGRFAQVYLIVIRRPVAGRRRIEPPQLAIGDDHPRRDLPFQQADYLRAGDFVRCFFIPDGIHIIQIAIPLISQRGGEGLALLAGAVQQIIGLCGLIALLRLKRKAQQREYGFVEALTDGLLRFTTVLLGRARHVAADFVCHRTHIVVPLRGEAWFSQAFFEVVIGKQRAVVEVFLAPLRQHVGRAQLLPLVVAVLLGEGKAFEDAQLHGFRVLAVHR